MNPDIRKAVAQIIESVGDVNMFDDPVTLALSNGDTVKVQPEDVRRVAREEGFVGTFKWGVEYRNMFKFAGGQKHLGLPEDICVCVKIDGLWRKANAIGCELNSWNWALVTDFMISDSRYEPKQKAEIQYGASAKMTPEISLVKEQWFDYDTQKAIALPPAGTICEFFDGVQKVYVTAYICGANAFDTDAVVWSEEPGSGHLYYGYIHDFRPRNTNAVLDNRNRTIKAAVELAFNMRTNEFPSMNELARIWYDAGLLRLPE